MILWKFAKTIIVAALILAAILLVGGWVLAKI